jgi:hypothetical protein
MRARAAVAGVGRRRPSGSGLGTVASQGGVSALRGWRAPGAGPGRRPPGRARARLGKNFPRRCRVPCSPPLLLRRRSGGICISRVEFAPQSPGGRGGPSEGRTPSLSCPGRPGAAFFARAPARARSESADGGSEARRQPVGWGRRNRPGAKAPDAKFILRVRRRTRKGWPPDVPVRAGRAAPWPSRQPLRPRRCARPARRAEERPSRARAGARASRLAGKDRESGRPPVPGPGRFRWRRATESTPSRPPSGGAAQCKGRSLTAVRGPSAPPKTRRATEAPPKEEAPVARQKRTGPYRTPGATKTRSSSRCRKRGGRKALPTKQEPQWSFFGGAGGASRCRASRRPSTGLDWWATWTGPGWGAGPAGGGPPPGQLWPLLLPVLPAGPPPSERRRASTSERPGASDRAGRRPRSPRPVPRCRTGPPRHADPWPWDAGIARLGRSGRAARTAGLRSWSVVPLRCWSRLWPSWPPSPKPPRPTSTRPRGPRRPRRLGCGSA